MLFRSHVVRAAELYKDRFIIYSLGNFCTAGDFSISGISGYAPIVKVNTDKKGKFISGQIISARQLDKTGPVLDSEHLAAKEIKRLTELDFPQTQLTISNEGLIERKGAKGETSTGFLMPERKEDNKNYASNLVVDSILDSVLIAKRLIAEEIIDYSKQFIGKSYRRGSKGPNAFDCSGFTYFVFKNFGYSLNSSCITQVEQGIKIDKEELKKGDLIFFKGRNSKSNHIGHVGIVVSNDMGNITFIHACNRGVIIDELNKSSYYKPRYVTGLRILEENS